MYWIEFYQRSVVNPIEAVAACGDRAVIIVDGRLSADKHHDIARGEGRKRGYPMYRICRGEGFTRVQKETRLHVIN